MVLAVGRYVNRLTQLNGDTLLTSPADGDVLTYEAATAKWKNKPAAGGGGGITGTGTTGKLPKWTTGSSVLGDSLLSDDGTNVTLASGSIILPNGAAGNASIGFGSTYLGHPTDGFYYDGACVIATKSFTDILKFNDGNGITLNSSLAVNWGSSGLTSPDLFVRRDAANTLSQRNGTTNQQSNLYETYTDVSNYSRLVTKADSATYFQMYPEASGTGTQRALLLADSPSLLRYLYLASNRADLYAVVSGQTSYVSCKGSVIQLAAGAGRVVDAIGGALTAPDNTAAQLRLNNTEGSVLEYTANHNVTVDSVNVTITGNNLVVGKGIAAAISAVKTANYTATTADSTVRADTTAGAVTVTLPTAVGVSGRKYTVKDVGGAALTNNITIATTSSQTIDGATTKVINMNYGSLDVVSDGANWMAV